MRSIPDPHRAKKNTAKFPQLRKKIFHDCQMRKCTLATFPAPQKKFHLPISIKNFPINKRISELKKNLQNKKTAPDCADAAFKTTNCVAKNSVISGRFPLPPSVRPTVPCWSRQFFRARTRLCRALGQFPNLCRRNARARKL